MQNDMSPGGVAEPLGGADRGPAARLPLTLIYMRVAAMLLLVAGLARACQILGIAPAGASFEDLAPAWRAGSATLLIVDLFASVGLWVGAAWGPVMWAVALAVEVSMYALFDNLFGSYPLRVLIHGLVFAGFLGVTFVEWRRNLAD
jgi:Family of unknown function (DUF6163)